MGMLAHLWLPILISAVAVWIASAVAWMALGHHQKDQDKLPDEEGLLAAVRSMGIKPGNYGFPHFGSRKECHTPEAKKKWEVGPMGQLSVWGKISMGRNMVLTFVVYLVVSFLIGYIGSVALKPGASFGQVFQLMGTAGVLAYCFSFIPGGIWFAQKPRALVMCVLDGVAFGLITGAVFAGMWPKM